MESFTIELVSNASAKLYRDKKLGFFTIYLPEQLNREGQREIAISEKTYPSLFQNVTDGKPKFLDTEISNSSLCYYLEPGLYHLFIDTVEAENSLIQERHNHREISIAVKMSRITKKVEIHLANRGSGLGVSNRELGHIFGSNVCKDTGVLLRGTGRQKPVFV